MHPNQISSSYFNIDAITFFFKTVFHPYLIKLIFLRFYKIASSYWRAKNTSGFYKTVRFSASADNTLRDLLNSSYESRIH